MLSVSMHVYRTCVADTSVIDFYADLIRFWGGNLNILNGQVFASFPGHSSLRCLAQGMSPLVRDLISPCM